MKSEEPISPDQLHGTQSYKGYVKAAMVFAVVGLLATVVYGYIDSSLALMALAVQSALITLACWLGLDMSGIREIDHSLKKAKAQRGGDSDIHGILDSDFNSRCHRHFIVLSVGFLLTGLTALYLLVIRPVDVEEFVQSGVPLGLICIVGGIVWAVLAKSFDQISDKELPEGLGLALAFREAQWSALLTGAAILLISAVWNTAELWVSRLVLLWLMAVSLEQLIRGVIHWRVTPQEGTEYHSPIWLFLRETFLVKGNPVSSLIETLEKQFGLSLRSSWAIRFVKTASLFLCPLLILLAWLLSSVVVVESNQMAVRKSFGSVSGDPLKSGLHFKLPWPFGEVNRYPVKTVKALQIGFVDPDFAKRKALLWSKSHGQEFNLVLGNSVDLVTVNMILYYKIHEDNQRFLDYAFQNQNPVEALETYAYRALMEYTQTSTLDEVMSINRAKFATDLENAIRDYAEKNRLGIELVTLALVNIHPPVEVSPDYLDVISADIDAKRNVLQAKGFFDIRLHQSEQESYEKESQAKVESANRVGRAYREAMEFKPLSEARAVAPQAYDFRLWYETWENALIGRRLLLIDKTLANDSGNFYLDLRSIEDDTSNSFNYLEPRKK